MSADQSNHPHENCSKETQFMKRNPFVNNVSLTKWQIFQVAVFSVTIAPIRAIVLVLSFVICWLLAIIFTIGADVDKPAGVFRMTLYNFLQIIGRCMLFIIGFHSIQVKGKRATSKEAPITIAVPHSSIWDIIIFFVTSPFPTVLSKSENFKIPVFGTLMKATQPILVQRNDVASKRNTVDIIRKRMKKPDNWPQLIVFPEGTCTNKKQLLRFKLGAFLAGVPVQPLIIRYKNQLDVFTWTEVSARAFTLIWLSLCQVQLNAEIEYLPVYHPCPDEINDALLFANNMQSYLATILRIPCSKYSYEDRQLMKQAGKLKFPKQAAVLQFYSISKKLNINFEDAIARLNEFSKMSLSNPGTVDLEDFAKFYNVPVTASLRELFGVFDPNQEGCINFCQYVIGFSSIFKTATCDENIKIAYNIMCQFDRTNTQLHYGKYTEELKNIVNLINKKFGKIGNEDQFRRIIKNNPGYNILLMWYDSSLAKGNGFGKNNKVSSKSIQ